MNDKLYKYMTIKDQSDNKVTFVVTPEQVEDGEYLKSLFREFDLTVGLRKNTE